LPGTILIADGTSVNRIMLRVLLSAAHYKVIQAETIRDALDQARRAQPDLVITALCLTDGTAMDLRIGLEADPNLAGLPILALTPQNDRAARLTALRAGIDDVLSHPLNDIALQARIRSLIRQREVTAVLTPYAPEEHRYPGFCEGQNAFASAPPRNRIAVLSRSTERAKRWRALLEPCFPGQVRAFGLEAAQKLMTHPAPDAVIVPISGADRDEDLSLLADLRSRRATRHATVIAVPTDQSLSLAAEAWDRGAQDALLHGFCAEELALRLGNQLRRKQRINKALEQVHGDLRAANRDPMTGLYNRRFLLPHLQKTIHEAENGRLTFALLLADLDHFKRINDRFGHPVGDAVLIETAKRLASDLAPEEFAARIGGEEFLILLRDVSPDQGALRADRLRRALNHAPMKIAGVPTPVRVTVSIGLVMGPLNAAGRQAEVPSANMLIRLADEALYKAKQQGRDRVMLATSAA
jgi:two-component system cell cycle response regulator